MSVAYRVLTVTVCRCTLYTTHVKVVKYKLQQNGDSGPRPSTNGRKNLRQNWSHDDNDIDVMYKRLRDRKNTVSYILSNYYDLASLLSTSRGHDVTLNDHALAWNLWPSVKVFQFQFTWILWVEWLTENAGRKNGGPSKLQGMKLQDMKMTDQKW